MLYKGSSLYIDWLLNNKIILSLSFFLSFVSLSSVALCIKLASEPSSGFMAPDARSKERMGDIEKQTEIHRVQLEQTAVDIGELKEAVSRIEALLTSLSTQSQQNAHTQTSTGSNGGNGGGSHRRGNPNFQFGSCGTNNYSAPTKHSRVEFPKFDGTNFRGWAYRCRQFFVVDATPMEQRVRLTSIHLEDKALKWHLNFMKNRREEDLSWDDYFKQMEIRFTDVHYANPMVQLKQLQQGTKKVEDYIDEFDELLSEVDIADDVAMSCFLGGLRSDIQAAVEAFKTESLASMMQMAKIQERSIQALCDVGTRTSTRSWGSNSGVTSKFSSSADFFPKVSSLLQLQPRIPFQGLNCHLLPCRKRKWRKSEVKACVIGVMNVTQPLISVKNRMSQC